VPDLSLVAAALILGLLVVGALGYFLLRGLRRRGPNGTTLVLDPAARKRAETLLREAQGLAVSSGDTREAVVQAYARFLEACAVLGVPRSAFETPREHGARAPERAGLPREAVEALVDAYETVRYAERDPPREARERALRGLEAILAHTGETPHQGGGA
ncbi:MAG TPA: DUF4129 domain-containing protein, partial [Candidatus Thermoplasmatota archaeon]|nr:DUF4129 domain-containing protein [Candidatus Thermoplasmatota archaeon]